MHRDPGLHLHQQAAQRGQRHLRPLFATTTVGTYHWVATYNGDANNTTVSSACAAEPVTITQATPAIATTPSAGGPVGTSISDTATVSGGFNPTGTVTFNLFPPTDATCAGTPVFTSTNRPLSGGSATSAPPFTTTAVGTYHWVATYNGDANNTTVSSGCTAEPVTITQATPTIATTPSAGGPVGTSIFDTATVSSGVIPTGTVTFNLFGPGDANCTATPVFTSTVSLATRQIVVTSGSFTTAAAGTYHWVATYNGDANNAAVSSVCADEPVVIGVASSAVVTTVPSPGVVVGGSISDTATVTGGFNPTGTVTFNLFPPSDTTCAGTPVFTSTNPLSGSPLSATSGPFATTTAGIYHWVATYNGDTNNAAVSSDCADEPVTISQATPAIATSALGGRCGRHLHLGHGDGERRLQPHRHGHLQPVPADGRHLRRDPGLHLHQPAQREPAQRHLGSLFATATVGTYHWVATYNGDANNTTVSSACAAEPVTITQATPAIATTPSAGGAGRHLHLGHGDGERRLQPHRHGHLQPVRAWRYRPAAGPRSRPFPSNPLSGGSATSGSITTVAVGTYHWVAIYNGDANNTTVSSGLRGRAGDHHPGRRRPSRPRPRRAGRSASSISDTATVSGGFIPTGTVTFNLFPPSDSTCTGTPVFTSTNPLSGSPLSATSAPLSRPPRWAPTTGSPPTTVTPTTPRSARPARPSR